MLSRLPKTFDVRILFRSGSRIQCPPSWHIDKYTLPYNKFYFVLEGSCFVELDGKIHLLLPGQMILIPQGKEHSMRHTYKKHLIKYYCHFSCDLIENEDLLSYMGLTEENLIISFNEEKEHISGLFNSMLFEGEYGNTTACLAHKTATLLEIIALYMEKRYLSKALKDYNAADFQPIIAYMEKNVDSNISLTQVAEMAFMSNEHFVRKFKSIYGIPPMKYFDKLRIDHAIAQIRDSYESFLSIARSIGISDIYQFSSFFKKHVGIAPKEYRRMIREIDKNGVPQ